MSAEHNFTIVVGSDFSELSDGALDQALEAASLREGAEVHVLHVVPDAGVAPDFTPPLESALDTDAIADRLRARTQQRIDRMPAHLRKDRIRRVMVHLQRGAAADMIAQLAAHVDADLVVVGSHGHRGLERLLLGSVAERVTRLARCTVWVVRPKGHATEGRVPEIEPPCKDCLEARRESRGTQFWCARHSERHYLSPHVYHYAMDGIFAADTAAYEATPERSA